MNDSSRPDAGIDRGTRDGKKRRQIGLVALLLLGAALAFPRAFWNRHRHPTGTGAGAQAAERERGVEEATAAIASLSSALGALSRVDSQLQAADPPPDPPHPGQFSSPTACVRSYLPDVDLADGSVDSLCTEADLWTTERTIDVRLAHRRGGARHWTRLGRYSMAALATMRAGCCAAPEPFTAVVPGLWCGVLRDQLRAFGPAPGGAVATDYEAMMRCLAARGVHLPERWARSSPEESRTAFDEFLRTAGARKKE